MTLRQISPPLPVKAPDGKAAERAYDLTLDGVRLIATLMVILIHISGKGFANMGAPHWWAVNAYESVSRTCVPLFFMITGALLLPRQHTVSSILNRVWKVLLPLLAWSVAFLCWYRYFGTSRSQWLASILREPVAGQLWYLYTLIPMYFFLPVLSAFYQNIAPRVQWLVVAAWFVSASVLPFLHALVGHVVVGINLSVFYIYPAYFVLGAVIAQQVKPTRPLTILAALAWAGSVAATALGTWIVSNGAPHMSETFYEYFSPIVFIGTLASFICIRAVFARLQGRTGTVQSLVRNFGKLSFGIYLMHPMVIWAFDMKGYDYHFTNPWLAIPILLAGVTLVSGLVVALLQRMPVLRSIVPG